MKQVIALFVAVLLSGCTPPPQDLERFITQTYASAKVTATGVANMPSFEPLAFDIGGNRDPFSADVLAPENMAQSKDECWQPGEQGPLSSLEQFDLGSLTLKGVIGVPGNYWALFEKPGGEVTRVTVGEYLGTNRGRVDAIEKETVSLTEHLPDGLGCWQTRSTKVAMNSIHQGG